MGTKLYVGNLPFSMTEQELRDTFASYGDVADAKVISDKFSGRSRGFGFVEMASEDQAKSAIEKLNDTELNGRKIIVNEAKPENKDRDRGPRSCGGGGGGGGGGRGPGGGGGRSSFGRKKSY